MSSCNMIKYYTFLPEVVYRIVYSRMISRRIYCPGSRVDNAFLSQSIQCVVRLCMHNINVAISH